MTNILATAKVVWLYGLSGAGKTTIAQQFVQHLKPVHAYVQHLDGDRLRQGLNSNLGFSDADRLENIRRSAEVAKLFLEAGFITLCSFITPTEKARQKVREVIGTENLIEVFVKASLQTCRQRDPKGLYKQVEKGEIEDFTGYGSAFEYPVCPDLVIDTERLTIEASVQQIYAHFLQKSARNGVANASY